MGSIVITILLEESQGWLLAWVGCHFLLWFEVEVIIVITVAKGVLLGLGSASDYWQRLWS